MNDDKLDRTGIDEKTKKIIIGVIKTLIPTAQIYLFGSRARGTHAARADIDIAIDAGHKLERISVGEIRDMLNASNIPYKIDVIDLHNVSEAMKKSVLDEGIAWNI